MSDRCEQEETSKCNIRRLTFAVDRERRGSHACSLSPPARAEEVKAGDLVITQAWTRATPGGAKIGGGYLTIENKGTAPDRLIGGSADVAGKRRRSTRWP